MVHEKRIDVLLENQEKKAKKAGKDIQSIDLNSIINKDVREVGAEWLSYQAMNQLQIGKFLQDQGWDEEDIELAQSHIISRAVYPASDQSGVYFLRTSLNADSEKMVRLFYNTILEVEATFRVLKSDLNLRPIYHKKDESTMAHLHLGLLAYWIVNTSDINKKKKYK